MSTLLKLIGRDLSTWPAIGNHTHCLIASLTWGVAVGAVAFLFLAVRSNPGFHRGSPLRQIATVLVIATALYAVASVLFGERIAP